MQIVSHPRLARGGSTRWLALAAVALVACGCGKSGPERIPVFPTEGKIIWNGQPVPTALVVLHPKGTLDARAFPARAQTAKDGTFKLTTYDTGDGVPPGEYTVTVEWCKLIQKDGEFKPGPNVLPPKYSQPTTSDLKIQVAEGPNVLEPFTLR